MFELDFDLLKEQGLQLVDAAVKGAEGIKNKGKNQLDMMNQQARLSRAQRQLGALVYSLYKSGEENQPLVDKYIQAVAEIEAAIDAIKANMTPAECAEAEDAAETVAEATDAEPAAEEAAAEESPEVAEEIIEEVPIELRGETKTCPVCGSQVDGDALFCNHCGAQIEG